MASRTRKPRRKNQTLRKFRFDAPMVIFSSIGAVLVSLIIACGFSTDSQSKYISEMKDNGIQGIVIMALIGVLIIVSMISAFVHRNISAAIIRFAIIFVLTGICASDTYSKIHDGMFAVAIIAYFGIGVLTAMAVMSRISGFLGFGVLLLIVIAVGGAMKIGPEWQKAVVLLLIVVESLNVYICFPQRISWNPLAITHQSV